MNVCKTLLFFINQTSYKKHIYRIPYFNSSCCSHHSNKLELMQCCESTVYFQKIKRGDIDSNQPT